MEAASDDGSSVFGDAVSLGLFDQNADIRSDSDGVGMNIFFHILVYPKDAL